MEVLASCVQVHENCEYVLGGRIFLLEGVGVWGHTFLGISLWGENLSLGYSLSPDKISGGAPPCQALVSLDGMIFPIYD